VTADRRPSTIKENAGRAQKKEAAGDSQISHDPVALLGMIELQNQPDFEDHAEPSPVLFSLSSLFSTFLCHLLLLFFFIIYFVLLLDFPASHPFLDFYFFFCC